MTQYPAPVKKPTLPDFNILLEALKNEMMHQLNCVKIGVVQAFYPGNANNAPTVDVKVAFTQVISTAADGTRTLAEYAPLLKVPVSFQQGGGCIMTFPVAAGDECLILFNDMQLDNWLLSGAGQPPSIDRTHDWSDAIAIVGVRSNPRGIASISTATAQLRSITGDTYVEIDPSGQIVNIAAPVQINLNSPIVRVAGVIDVINENSESNPCNISGAISATGDIVAGAGSANIHLLTHHHTGVTPGGGNTGGPA
jgi:hypothetical protein